MPHTRRKPLVLGSYAGVFLSLKSVPCMMVHISDDGLSCQTQEGEEECHYNCIQGYFNRCWLLLLLKAEQFAAQILCSGGNGTHCYFLSLPTPVSSLQDFLYSLSSVLVWFIMLWAKITSFTFLHWRFSSKWNLPASFCFNGPLQKWQRCLVRLIGTIYALKEMTPFLWALSCVCVCVRAFALTQLQSKHILPTANEPV